MAAPALVPPTDPERATESAPVLLLGLTGMQQRLDLVFADAGYWLQPVATLAGALDLLQGGNCPVLVTEAILPDGSTWRDVLIRSRGHAHPPSVIVLAGQQDGGLWADVLREGGFDTLFDPIAPESLRRDVEVACRRWSRERAQSEMRARAALASPVIAEDEQDE